LDAAYPHPKNSQMIRKGAVLLETRLSKSKNITEW
jgi:hypothetical protein